MSTKVKLQLLDANGRLLGEVDSINFHVISEADAVRYSGEVYALESKVFGEPIYQFCRLAQIIDLTDEQVSFVPTEQE